MTSQQLAPRAIDDYWAIVQRRFWWIALPLFLCWSLVWTMSWLLPNFYQSEALILVEQQKVPENYVASNVTTDLQDRLQSMTQQILSRTRLQTTIDRFRLYRTPHHKLGFGLFKPPGDPVDQMRSDIVIDLVRSTEHGGELTAFKIKYSAESPSLAQQVNSELTSLFIQENLKAQQQQAENTTAFLQNQLEGARISLQDQEAKVRSFKAAHFGDLPTQMQSNVQILSGLQAELETTERDLQSAKQQKLYLESLRQYQSQHPGDVVSGSANTDTPDQELMVLQKQLVDARAKYTDEYPDVVALREKIAAVQLREREPNDSTATATDQKAGLSSQAAGPDGTGTLGSPATTSTFQIQSQLKANAFEIENYGRQTTDLQSKISRYQARLNLTPQTEQELADVSRGYDESMANYNSLLQKQMQSQLATSLEQQQQGQQFRILDPPSLPPKPSSPNHLKLSLIGLTMGIIAGLVFTALLEATHVRIWHAKGLQGIVSARVLVAIPHLSALGEDRFRTLFQVLKICLSTVMALVIVAGTLYAFVKS